MTASDALGACEAKFLSSYLLDCEDAMLKILNVHERSNEHGALIRKGAGICLVCDKLRFAKTRLAEEVERIARMK